MGYASEAALSFGLQLQPTRSRRIALFRIGKKPSIYSGDGAAWNGSKREDDFDHPMIDADSDLRRHVLYRMSRQRWLSSQPD